MDEIKKKIEEMVSKLTKDASLKKLFQQNPIQAVEKVLGVDLPDDQVAKIVEGVKAKISVDQAAGALDKLKGMFGK